MDFHHDSIVYCGKLIRNAMEMSMKLTDRNKDGLHVHHADHKSHVVIKVTTWSWGVGLDFSPFKFGAD
jgi:sensor histidine kinase regulating citrate/malate metabolism